VKRLRWSDVDSLLFLRAIALICSAADHPKIIVLVIDGLRPDVIRPEIMPNLARLKQAGVWCANGHSVFPTVTRVNSASIGSGTVPSVHGIVSNTMWVDSVSPKPFDTSNYRNLTKLAEVSGGRTLPVRHWARCWRARGSSTSRSARDRAAADFC
jgi:predicted AlkP superfamily pyrophosphatase or phosphodiesterase